VATVSADSGTVTTSASASAVAAARSDQLGGSEPVIYIPLSTAGISTRGNAPAFRHPTTLGKQKNVSGDRASPLIVWAAFCCGGHRRAVDDQAAVLVNLLTLVPRGLGIKIEANMVAARSSACSPLSLAVMPYPCSSEIYPYISGSAVGNMYHLGLM
jgi:hypothetical protein